MEKVYTNFGYWLFESRACVKQTDGQDLQCTLLQNKLKYIEK